MTSNNIKKNLATDSLKNTASDWKIVQSELLFQNRWIELYKDKIEVGTGRITRYTWYKSPDGVVILPHLSYDNTIYTSTA